MMYKDIVFFVVIIKIATGQIMWVLKETPALFGKDVQLVCSLPNDTSCCRKYIRKWNVGWRYTLTIMNDKSLNETKYCEELNEISRTSTLTIKSFSITDVDIPYECVYGFKKYRKTLRLKEDAYEFHPKEQLPVTPIVNKDQIHLNVTFRLVYPAPVCSAKIGVNNISSDLNVSTIKHNLLYMSTITLNYTTSSTECMDSLIVICIVGKTVLTVTDFIPCSSKDAVLPLEISIAIASVVFVVFLLIIFGVYYKRKKCDVQRDQPEHAEVEFKKELLTVSS